MHSVDIIGQIAFQLLRRHLEAACREADPGLFFVERGKSVGPAIELCAGCPGRQECLDYAVYNHLTFGIFGGLSYDGRKRLMRERRPELVMDATGPSACR